MGFNLDLQYLSVFFSRTERSTDQVNKPVNLEALSKWVSAIPEDVKRDMRTLAPMLERLGYDPDAYPPNYGEADKFVADNTVLIKDNEDNWRKRGQDVINMEKPQRHYSRNPDAAANNKDVYGKDFDDDKNPSDKDNNNGNDNNNNNNNAVKAEGRW